MASFVRTAAERFESAHPDIAVTVSGGGSSAGLTALRDDAADVALLARPATEEEREHFMRKRRVDLVGVPVALDAVVAFVRDDNPLRALSLQQVGDVCRQRVHIWEKLGIAVEGTALRPPGPRGEYDPTRGIPIRLCAPSAKFGAAGLLRIRAMSGIDFASSLQRFDEMHELVQAVAQDPNAVGFAAWGQAAGVRLVPISHDSTSPPIAATPASVRTHEYPLAHYLYFYFAGEPADEARSFLAFVLSPDGQAIIESSSSGAVPLPFANVPQ